MSAAQYVQLNTAAALRTAAARFPGWPLLIAGGRGAGGARGGAGLCAVNKISIGGYRKTCRVLAQLYEIYYMPM